LMPYDPVVNDHLGDNYWMVGRKREARFQWQRAQNYAEDIKLKENIAAKLENGLPAVADNSKAEIYTERHTTAP